jgi:hypothetical protein
VDKHRGKALNTRASIGQADIVPIRPRIRPAAIRMGTYSQGGLWITGTRPATRQIPASRSKSMLWMEMGAGIDPQLSRPFCNHLIHSFSDWLICRAVGS